MKLSVSRMKNAQGLINKICLIALILSCLILSAEIIACVDTTVRDAVFSEKRDIHRMCVIGDADDPKTAEIYEIISLWFEASGDGMNIELVIVDAADPNVQWEEYGLPSAPPSHPVVVLAGTHTGENKRFFIDYWVPFPGIEDMRILKTSPAREALKREVLRRTAVLLYIPGTGRNAGSAGNVVDSTAELWSARDSLGVSVVRVNRGDKRERILLSFTGVENSEEDWVGVVFGWGKLMAPLVGGEITTARLNDKISTLLEECTCLTTASALGVDIPLVMDESVDIPALNFAGAITSGDNVAEINLTSIASLSGDGTNPDNTKQSGSGIDTRNGILRYLMLALGSLFIVVGAVTAVIVWPRNGKHNSK